MVERVIRTFKEQCAHRDRFESLQHASRVIGDWIGFYNHQRPHQTLGIKTPTEAYALAAQSVQFPLGQYMDVLDNSEAIYGKHYISSDLSNIS